MSVVFQAVAEVQDTEVTEDTGSTEESTKVSLFLVPPVPSVTSVFMLFHRAGTV